MTEERQSSIQKDLLWDYTSTKTKLEVFRVKFRDLADSLDATSKILRASPEDLADFDFSHLQGEFSTIVAVAKEYRDTAFKNAERAESLIKSGIDL